MQKKERVPGAIHERNYIYNFHFHLIWVTKYRNPAFTTQDLVDDMKAVLTQLAKEYICSRFLQPAGTTRVYVSVEKKLMLTQEFDASPEQMLIIQDGGNPFEKEMDALFENASELDFDSDYCIENLDTGKNLVPWND